MAARVSVVIPCFNLGRYVDEAVQSVLAQTFQDVEIVIVNDGSTDPVTSALLARYDRPKTRVLTTGNRGLAAARNLGIAETRGEYLCALDADDRLAPRYLETAVSILDGDPSVAFVSTWLEMFGEETGLWKQEVCDLPTLLAEDTVHTAAVVRRDVVRAVGGYDGGMGEQGYEDWDLWLTIVERGHRGVIVPEALFHYRRRAGSMSATCCEGQAHLGLVRYMVAKHEASYRRHLIAVMRRRHGDIARHLALNYELERELAASLEPRVAARRAELGRLRAKLEGAGDARVGGPCGPTPAVAPQDLARARAEIAALRRSWSWRVTAPGRAAWGFLRRLGGAP